LAPVYTQKNITGGQRDSFISVNKRMIDEQYFQKGRIFFNNVGMITGAAFAQCAHLHRLILGVQAYTF